VDVEEGGQYIQTVGKQLTYLRRYGLSALFLLSTEEDTDGQPAKKAKPKTKGNLKQKLAGKAAEIKGQEVTDKQRGMLAGMLEMCFTEEPTKNRKIFMDMVWDTTSTKELTPEQVLAGLDFLRISDNPPLQRNLLRSRCWPAWTS